MQQDTLGLGVIVIASIDRWLFATIMVGENSTSGAKCAALTKRIADRRIKRIEKLGS
jgi:hypothetical protein